MRASVLCKLVKGAGYEINRLLSNVFNSLKEINRLRNEKKKKIGYYVKGSLHATIFSKYAELLLSKYIFRIF